MLPPRLHIKLFRFKVQSFHFFGELGYILGTILGVIITTQIKMQPEIVLLMAAVGAATFFLLVYISKWVADEEIIVYYHHEISILLFCILTLYLLKQPILPHIDITLLGISVVLAFGRIGCYLVGCCHGRPHKHEVTYGQEHVHAGFTWFYKDIPLLPVQLIESAYVFLTVIVSIILLLTYTIPGTVIIVFTVVYGLMRYTLEFFRGDPDRPLFQGLSEAQWTTLALTAITFGMSRINWLPAYTWHGLILVAMIAASFFAVYCFNWYPDHRLFNPQHVLQLANGLNELAATSDNREAGKQQMISLYTTKGGLSVSCNKNQTGSGLHHFTLSMKNKTKMRRSSADRIARLISILKKYPDHYGLLKSKMGYTILYTTTKADKIF